MNAGAYGSEIKDVLVSTKYIDIKTGSIFEISNKEHCFEYRHSIFADKDYIILSSLLKLQYGKEEEIQAKIKELTNKRREKQPINYPSAGSVFKRPKDNFAAKLIQDAGLKGYQIGGAQVSELHSGFIINKESASAKDVIDLINYIKHEVYKKFNVMLEEEILIIG